MGIFPQQSFQHTQREISVNRHDPCELLRETISNSYDAGAKQIWIFPLYQYKGILIIDDGSGISMQPDPKHDHVSPYISFFSIGKGTKTKGQQIGYKCQGAKLCFASKRFSMITRCIHESNWRGITVENPKERLNEAYDLTPNVDIEPAKYLSQYLEFADERTTPILELLSTEWIENHLRTGTILLIQDFEAENFDFHFSSRPPSYLYEYIRFYTAHGDTRLISTEQGFNAMDVKAIQSTIRRKTRPKLWLWTDRADNDSSLAEVPSGWPYLEAPAPSDPPAETPDEVSQLRKGRFMARFAHMFNFRGQSYSIIFAIDGKRRRLDRFDTLSRQSDKRSGISLADQSGV